MTVPYANSLAQHPSDDFPIRSGPSDIQAGCDTLGPCHRTRPLAMALAQRDEFERTAHSNLTSTEIPNQESSLLQEELQYRWLVRQLQSVQSIKYEIKTKVLEKIEWSPSNVIHSKSVNQIKCRP